MKWFLYSKSEGALLVRTVVEALLSYLLTIIPEVTNWFEIPDGLHAPIVGVLTIVITTILSFIRGRQEKFELGDNAEVQ